MHNINCGDTNAVVLIPLSNTGGYALVNKRDACLVRMFTWQDHMGYARASLPGKRYKDEDGKWRQKPHTRIRMHRLILGVHGMDEKTTHVDHDDSVRWNNTRKNIAAVGIVENCRRSMRKRTANYWAALAKIG